MPYLQTDRPELRCEVYKLGLVLAYPHQVLGHDPHALHLVSLGLLLDVGHQLLLCALETPVRAVVAVAVEVSCCMYR